MANTKIRKVDPAFTGATLYLKVWNSAGLYWNGTSLVGFVLANLRTYVIAFPEIVAGSGIFELNFSTLGVPANDTYEAAICLCAGGAPASSHAVIGDAKIDDWEDYWDGATLGLVQLDLAQPVPTSNDAETIGDALNGARAQAFGKWEIVGSTLTLYAADGTTIVRQFTLDSATNASSRT